MTVRLFLILFAFLTSFYGYSQQNLEYLGVIKLNDTSFISYRISFIENEGLLKGFSVTDFGGAHETKSFLSGYFDDTENTLSFYESGILYTKSPIVQDDFCYVHFEGRLKNMNKKQEIEGNFKGLYDNGDECINGSIKMASFGKMLKRAKKLDRKIDRNILIGSEIKDKVNLSKSLDSLRMNIVKKGERLNVFSKSERIKLRIYDAGLEDGDKISVLVNSKILLSDFIVTSKKVEIEISLSEEITLVKIEALNTGKIGGNTVKIDVIDGTNIIETLTNLQTNESAEFVFIRKE